MTVVKKATNPGSVVSKRTASTSVTSQLQRTKLSDMTDASFGTLDASSDGKFISYDESIKKFTLVSADDLLTESIGDNDLPDAFVSIVEEQIDLGEVSVSGINADGGTFLGE